MLRRTLPLLLVLAATPVGVRAQVRVGTELAVNTYTTNLQGAPDVAADGDGNFVVVWVSVGGQDGSGNGVFGRWYDAAGTPLGASEIRVNAQTADHQNAPSVASAPDGRTVVVWMSRVQDGSSYGIFGRQYAPGAASVGPEFQVNQYTTGQQISPVVAMDESGGFVVAWQSDDGSEYGIFARRFDALGQPLGNEFPVNTYTSELQARPAVASDGSGNFVVAWEGEGHGTGGFDVSARRYDATGAPASGEFLVHVPTLGHQRTPAVSMDPDGNFVVVWNAGSPSVEVWGQRFDAAGVKQGGEFLVNGYTTGLQVTAAVAVAPEGRFAVAWQSDTGDGNLSGTFARMYDAQGGPEGDDFQLHTYVTGDQSSPTLAMDARANLAAAWLSPHDGSDLGVFAQRFRPDLIFRDGFEQGTAGAWSSSATDGGDLSVSPLAALNSTSAGLRALVDDTAGIFVQDDRPDDENRYRARFYFDPNGFDPGEAQNRFRTRIFIAFSEAPMRRVAAIVLRRLGGQYSIRARARRNDNSQADTPFVPISDGPHRIELDLRRARGTGVANGELDLWIDGALVASLTALENSLGEVDFVRMGALSVKAGATGTMYWDEFESRRLAVAP